MNKEGREPISDSASSADLLTVGKITAVFGVKGWLKVHSFTEPMENILAYENWWLEKNGHCQAVCIDDARRHGNGIVIHIKDVDDRDIASAYCKSQIQVPVSAMPDLEDDDYYWHQLEGLKVYQLDEQGQQGVLIGTVDYLMETGANDVLVIKAEAAEAPATETAKDASDKEKAAGEVLVPYLHGDVVKSVDLENGLSLVDWQLD